MSSDRTATAKGYNFSVVHTPLEYHQRTKHLVNRYAIGPGRLDWASQPDSFRHFERTDTVSLPIPAIEEYKGTPVEDHPLSKLLWRDLAAPRAPAPLNSDTLSRFLFYSLSLSAWKETRGNRWSLRVHPSAGNLHALEAYAIVPDAVLQADHKPSSSSTLVHYKPDVHGVSVRCRHSFDLLATLGLPSSSLLVGLTSLTWREAWKYGERSWRYCMLDTGHALAALRFSAALLGWRVALVHPLSNEAQLELLGLQRAVDFPVPPEREEPQLLVAVVLQPLVRQTQTQQFELAAFPELARRAASSGVWSGVAARLSKTHSPWPVVDDGTRASECPPSRRTVRATLPPLVTVPRGASGWSATAVIRRRRSAGTMDPRGRMSRAGFFHFMRRLLPRGVPWDTGLSTVTHLFVFVHRVEGLPRGLYFLVRCSEDEVRLRKLFKSKFVWTKPEGCPEDLPLHLLFEGDARKAARKSCCGQELASDGVLSVGMLARFAGPLKNDPHSLRTMHWECGMLGQVMHLEAEALDLQGNGIGAFFDDVGPALLGLKANQTEFQSLYHFAVGAAVKDKRLRQLDGYFARR